MSSNKLVSIPQAKLGMPPALVDQVSPEQWSTLCNVFFSEIEDPRAIHMAISYAKAQGLDIMRKPIEIVPYAGKYKMFLSIHGLRALARRGGYCGSKEPRFGKDKEFNIGGVKVIAPEWCQFVVLDGAAGKVQEFFGSRVYFEEYVQKTKAGEPNSNWRNKPRMMLQKCAEAAALRAAFPEVGAQYDADEIGAFVSETNTEVQDVESVESLEASIIDVDSEPLVTQGNAGKKPNTKQEDDEVA